MNGFSIITPLDTNRLQQFMVTKRVYDTMRFKKEFIIPTRSATEVRKFLKRERLMRDVRLFSYTLSEGFNVSRALNIGVRNAKYEQIIITSPEVVPTTRVLEQLEPLIGRNVVCQVFDEDIEGDRSFSLVNNHYRNINPAYYFLAMYNKKDIEAINGWDEEFIKGYAYEDDDFGARWNRAGLPFEIHEEIQAVHQYHPRSETIPSGAQINQTHLNDNNASGIIKCANGLTKITIE